MNRSSIQLRVITAGVVGILGIVSSTVILPQQVHAQSAGCAALLTSQLTGNATGIASGVAVAGAIPLSGLPTADKGGIIAQVAVSHGQATKDTTKCILDSLAWTVAKTAIQSITRSTVNWINSGFNGSPAFVSDLQQNLGNLSDAVANDFFNNLTRTANDVTGFNIKSPFQDQLNQKLRSEYYLATSNTLGLSQYDLQGQSSNPSAFIAGDFSQGGFNAYFSASQNPANNPFGAYTLASNALWQQIDAASKQRTLELQAGKMFLPWRGSCASTPTPAPKPIAASGDGSMISLDTVSSDAVSLSTAEKCRNNTVKTPGSVIESQLENNLGTGIRQLELANSINQIVGALAGQLVNQVLGAGGLLGASQPSSGGGSSYINQATSPSQYSTATTGITDGVLQSLTNDRTAVQTYRDNWQKILDVANAAQLSCGPRSDISMAVASSTAAVARGNTALASIDSIQNQIQSASNSNSVNQSTNITAAITSYQTYLSSGVVPSIDEQTEASTQSTDTSGVSTTTPSLYTQLVSDQRSCTVT